MKGTSVEANREPGRLRRVWGWIGIAGPVVSIVLLQAFYLIVERPHLWGTVRPSERVCVLAGPRTPFGHALVLAAIPAEPSGEGLIRPRFVGVSFHGPLSILLDHGYHFQEDGRLSLRLGERRIWTIDPWRGTKKRVAVIEAQDPLSDGQFSSEEFCVAGDVVWFHTFDRDWFDAVFRQQDATVETVFRSPELPTILSCTERTALISWVERKRYFLARIERGKNAADILLERTFPECGYQRNPGEGDSIVYSGRDDAGQPWFRYWTRERDDLLLPTEGRLRAVLSRGTVFFLNVEDRSERHPTRTQIEEMDLQSRKTTRTYWVRGMILGIAERS